MLVKLVCKLTFFFFFSKMNVLQALRELNLTLTFDRWDKKINYKSLVCKIYYKNLKYIC